MKLAMVLPGGVDRSGERRVIPAVLALLARLAAEHELHVFTLLQEREPATWQLLGAQVHNIGARRTLSRALAAIAAEHRRNPFHAVLSIFSGPAGLTAGLAARYLRIPGLVHVTGGELVALPQIAYGGRLTWKGRLREAIVLRLATQVSTSSEPMVQQLTRLGIAAQRIALGVDLRRWPVCPPRKRNAVPRLIQVASLNRVKHPALVLAALQQMRTAGADFHMDFVGEDTLQGELQALTRQLGLARQVRFHGFLTQRELYPLMLQADLMLVSSWHEAGPFAVLEAAVVGVPTVGTDVGHIAEWAPAAACVVPQADPAALAHSTLALLSDDDRRLELAAEAQRRAIAENADYTANSFSQLLARLAADRTSEGPSGLTRGISRLRPLRAKRLSGRATLHRSPRP
ncbi:MAG: glycosyltransferase family 4 protein [Sinobacteraceae bacterium]|nr:glycosyltransferase family 4 protein [Nevskiaceae bacterium]